MLHRDGTMESEREVQPIEHLVGFYEQAHHETDPAWASDLRFCADLAQNLLDQGGRALVVGGFVRDSLIARHTGEALASKDIDIEVYGVPFGQLVPALRAYGEVNLVGASFGIAKLTNPESGDVLDFSIPRRDSKVDRGHRGFIVTGDPTMTIAEAAKRRDLTINALAMDPLTGELIDEYGGAADIKAGVLRATDPELFTDDPLRVLRVMQFAGRFGFDVDPPTADLCRSLDLTELPAERVGEEWLKLITKSPRPSVGLEVARELGVLDQLHPELAVLDTIPQESEWHPEGNVWNHTKHAIDAAVQVVQREGLQGDDALVVLFGALCHDLGKATTTARKEKNGVMRITAHGHETAGIEPSKRFLEQIQMKRSVVQKVLPIVRDHLWHVHVPEPTPKQLGRFAQRLHPASIRLWDLVSRCDSNGRGHDFEPTTRSHAIYLQSLDMAVAEAPPKPIVGGHHLIELLGMKPGPEFGPLLDLLLGGQLDGAFSTPEEGIAWLQKTHIHANATL
ncbi:MAG TPA: HD domain-containing protein [Verrucomicrobiae bacterium]|nr:HD domain-containing protein [Verrucomicrobiae bacterium]